MADDLTDPTAAGWKRDPFRRFAGRYWDGNAWTEHVVSADRATSVDPLPPKPPERLPDWPEVSDGGRGRADVAAPVEPRGSEAARKQAATIVLGGAAAVAVGCFLPWAELSAPFVGTIAKSGMEGGDGVFFLALATGVAVIGASLRRSIPDRPKLYQAALAVLGLALLALTAFEVSDLSSRFADANGTSDLISTSYGAGIWLVGIGSSAAALGWLRMPWRTMAPKSDPDHPSTEI